jgi:flagellar basal-body rod modification protein FlgD
MSVSATNAASSAAGSSTTNATSSAISKDDFLKLLVAQLKYQDPLDPQKPDQFVSELAQFTQVEQMTNMSSSLSTLATKTTSSQWVSAIGKRVNVSSTTLSPGDELVISPQSDYDKVVLTLKDASTGGTTTKTMYKGDSLVYTNSGTSTYTVSATVTKGGSAVNATATVLKQITGVSVSDTGNTLVFGDGTTMDATSATVITQ